MNDKERTIFYAQQFRYLCANRIVGAIEPPPRRTMASRWRAARETWRAFLWAVRDTLTLGDVIRIVLETIFVAAVLYFLLVIY